MLFFHKCIIYKDNNDIVIHDVVRVKNAFHFSIDDEDYCKVIMDILVKYVGYNKKELLSEINNIIIFVLKMLDRDFYIENYEMYIRLVEYCEEMFV